MKIIPLNSENGNGNYPILEPREPAPTTDPPNYDELISMLVDNVCVATDGCTVEPDGVCEHGHPSWLIKLGYV